MIALLSVSNKDGLVPFASGLHALGWKLLSTGGTLASLHDAQIPATKVAAHTGSPEILGGRVKTLHPKIHGGLLARPHVESDRIELAANGIDPIGILAVNLYPFREVVDSGASRDEAIENIDIGGPAMIRAAAKNADCVTVVVDPADYPLLLQELEQRGTVGKSLRQHLQVKAFRHTAAYDAAVAAYLGVDEPLPFELTIEARRSSVLRYGENPHQRAAVYTVGAKSPTLAWAKQLQGKELSYNNLLDLDSAWSLVLEFAEQPASVIVKHTTPCGVAVGDQLEDVFRKARAVDEQSAFGGIVAVNRPLDALTASAIVETFLEAVVAPSVTLEAAAILAGKRNLRVLEVGSALAKPGATMRSQMDYRSIGGGLLAMERDAVEPVSNWRTVTKRSPTSQERAAAAFAWSVVKHVKSNAIAFASPSLLLAQAGGQTSRVEAVKIAAERGGSRLAGSAAASDAFFPFRDGLDAVAATGATCVVQPGGSVRDEEVIAAANEHKLAMLFTGIRHFRH